jgi:hypothetical protein
LRHKPTVGYPTELLAFRQTDGGSSRPAVAPRRCASQAPAIGGAKTFFLTLDGSGTRHTIGRYPDISLANARTAAKRMRAEKTLGRVFQAPKSLIEARQEYLSGLTSRPNINAYYKRNLARLKGPKLTDETPRTINRILDGLGEASKLQALRTYTAFFNWCLRRHYPPAPTLPYVRRDHSLALLCIPFLNGLSCSLGQTLIHLIDLLRCAYSILDNKVHQLK